MRRHAALIAIACATLGVILPQIPDADAASADTRVPHAGGWADKKDAASDATSATSATNATNATNAEKTEDAKDAAPSSKLLATLVQTHTGERVLLDASSPTEARFDELLADRTTGSHAALDPRLVGLLRKLAEDADGDGQMDILPARIELVSGYRSEKLNEMLRKKGHHVASHSQHSLGHACDFRLIPAGQTEPIEPAEMRRRIRALGWDGGIGIYPTKSDRFVHADVGPNRNWVN